MTSKQCLSCSETLPLASFPKDRTKSDGHLNQCKACRKNRALELSGPLDEEKQCNDCGEVKDRDQFHRLKTAKGGLQRKCIDCQTKFRATNAPLYRAIRKKYRESEAGRIVDYQINAKRRALKASLPFIPYDPVDIYNREAGVCYLCGFPVHKFHKKKGKIVRFFHVEHIIPIAADRELLALHGIEHPGDVPHNLSVAHPTCNSKKNNKVTEETIEIYKEYQELYGVYDTIEE